MPTRMSRRVCSQSLLAWVLVAMAAGMTQAGPLDDLDRYCYEPEEPSACTAFLGRLAALADPGPEERLALILGRDFTGQLDGAEKALCDALGDLLRDHPEYAEAWYEFSYCVDGQGETVALLETALAIDPAHTNAISSLTGIAEHGWYDYSEYGIPAGQLIRYLRTGYETTLDKQHRLAFARLMYRTSLESGHPEAAEALQHRVRRDFGLDTLDYSEKGRAASLEIVCSFTVLYVLTEACVAALESLFIAAATDGVPVLDDVIKVIPGVLSALDYVPPPLPRNPSDDFVETVIVGGPPALPMTESAKARYAARLKRAMESIAQPSTEHERVYSMFREGL